MDALFRVSWPKCMSDTMGMFLCVTSCSSLGYVRSHALKGPSPVPLKHTVVTCMCWSPVEEDSWQAHLHEHQRLLATGPPGLTPSWVRWLQGSKMGLWTRYPLKPTDLVELKQLLQECNHFKLRKGILYQKLLPRDSLEGIVLVGTTGLCTQGDYSERVSW